MITNKMSLLNLLSTWPLVGKRFRTAAVGQLLKQLDIVEKGFSSPSVRFTHNIHTLHIALQGFGYKLREDFGYFKGLEFNPYTKTSARAFALLDVIKLNNGLPELDFYFKDTLKDSSHQFLDWYSNQDTVVGFVSNTIQLLDIYVCVNPPTEDGEPCNFQSGEISYNTREFIGGRYFKFLVLDFIQVLKILLHLEQRGNYGKEK